MLMQPDGQDQDLLSLYQSIILDHGKSPRNTGRVERHDCSSEGRNPLCGDRVTVTAALDESDILTDLKFDAKGCAISIASASMMTEAAKGLTTDEVQRISDAVRILCIEMVYVLTVVLYHLKERMVSEKEITGRNLGY